MEKLSIGEIFPRKGRILFLKDGPLEFLNQSFFGIILIRFKMIEFNFGGGGGCTLEFQQIKLVGLQIIGNHQNSSNHLKSICHII